MIFRDAAAGTRRSVSRSSRPRFSSSTAASNCLSESLHKLRAAKGSPGVTPMDGTCDTHAKKNASNTSAFASCNPPRAASSASRPHDTTTCMTSLSSSFSASRSHRIRRYSNNGPSRFSRFCTPTSRRLAQAESATIFKRARRLLNKITALLPGYASFSALPSTGLLRIQRYTRLGSTYMQTTARRVNNTKSCGESWECV